ncbi:MAG: tRNA threonylcarbamoyladenosine biosynthesis protein TsaE [Actinomycetota bacterium]|jgi:tRNA threonylcarbamoyladenosine biosynthesis protein TsaE|nr:tRNA threonylcarbamoyladenosine biosynthesis protein TsaE [Actinomycetota bacterium]
MASLVVRTATSQETRALGSSLAQVFRERDVVLLTGELGAGKTTLVQGIVAGLGSTDHVQSPTFTLIREYTGRLLVAHVDVYRLERVQDVVDLGLEEIGDGDALLLVEWGDAVQDLLPADHLQVSITTVDPTGADETRRIELWGQGPSWDERWDRIGALGGSRSPA